MKKLKTFKPSKTCFYCTKPSFGKYHIECYRTFPSSKLANKNFPSKKEAKRARMLEFSENRRIHKERVNKTYPQGFYCGN